MLGIEEDHSGVGLFTVLIGLILLVATCGAVVEFLGGDAGSGVFHAGGVCLQMSSFCCVLEAHACGCSVYRASPSFTGPSKIILPA